MEKSENLWSRNFVLIIVINFLVFMNHIMLLSTFPFYIESLGGAPVTQLPAIWVGTVLKNFPMAPVEPLRRGAADAADIPQGVQAKYTVEIRGR